MRYISAQFIAYFRNDLWKRNASHANEMARLLESEIRALGSGITITQPVQSNGVFVIMPENVARKVSSSYFFYPWNEAISEYRLMTSWDTSEGDIREFVRLLGKELESA
jgi:threonine aldolase